MKLQIQTAVKSAPRYPAIQLPARFVVGNINRDASRVGKASSDIAKKTMRKRESNVRSRIFLATAHAAHATSCGRWHRALQVIAGERRATSGQRRATTASCGRRQFIFLSRSKRFCRLAEVTRHFRCGAPSSLSFRVLKRTTAPGTRLRALIRLRPVPVNT